MSFSIRAAGTPAQRRRAIWKKESRRRWQPAMGDIACTTQDQDPEQNRMSQPHVASSINLPDDLDLREEVRVRIETDRRLNQATVAREAGISATTLSQWLSGTYAGNIKQIEEKIGAWYRSELERQSSSGLPTGPLWVDTPSSERAISTMRYAQLAADIVLIYGGAGTGKSKSIERYHRMAPNVFRATSCPASKGVAAILGEIAKAVGLRDFPTASAAVFRQICQKVTGSNGLLIIDEAQHLSLEALDQVRAIHDMTGIGIALVGNEAVYARMTGGTVRAAYLDRLYSRIGKRTYLKRSTEADIDAFAKGWNITDPACRKQIQDIGGKPGALRVLNKVLRLAASYAQAENRPLCCSDVRAAYNELGGES